MTRRVIEPDDRYGAALLSRLAGEPDPASRIDLTLAMAVGGRRRRVRRAAGITAVVVVTAVAVAAAPAAVGALQRGPDHDRMADGTTSPRQSVVASGHALTAPGRCVPAWLPVPGITSEDIVVSAGDPSGRWLVGRFKVGAGKRTSGVFGTRSYVEGLAGDHRTLVWKDGELVGQPALPGENQQFEDVNSSGTAVGVSMVGDIMQPYVFRHGKVSRLSGLDSGIAHAINEAGTIVGARHLKNHPVPVRWKSATEPAVDLPLPRGFTSGVAFGVDDDGTVAGYVMTVRGPGQAYVWRPDGSGRLLAHPRVDGKTTEEFTPMDIRNGWVVGVAASATRHIATPGRYRLADDSFAQLSGEQLMVTAVNSRGWAVGHPHITPGAVLFRAGHEPAALPFDLPGASGQASTATAISDDGRVVAGSGHTVADRYRPVIWTCG